jgi:hypothetical protein
MKIILTVSSEHLPDSDGRPKKLPWHRKTPSFSYVTLRQFLFVGVSCPFTFTEQTSAPTFDAFTTGTSSA